MALPVSGSLSILDSSGSSRSISREVQGNLNSFVSFTNSFPGEIPWTLGANPSVSLVGVTSSLRLITSFSFQAFQTYNIRITGSSSASVPGTVIYGFYNGSTVNVTQNVSLPGGGFIHNVSLTPTINCNNFSIIVSGAGGNTSITLTIIDLFYTNQSLSTLSIKAGRTAPHGMLEFYGYSGSIFSNVNINPVSFTTSVNGTYRGSFGTFNIDATNYLSFGAGTFGFRISKAYELYGNATGVVASVKINRIAPTVNNTTYALTFSSLALFGIKSSTSDDLLSYGSSVYQYTIAAEEQGTTTSVNAFGRIALTSVWIQNIVVPTIVSTSVRNVGTATSIV